MWRRIRSGAHFWPLLLAVAALTGCETESLVSKSQEVEIGRQAAKDIEARHPVSKDAELNATVNDIGQYIAARSDRTDIQYTFKVLDIKDVNAVSLPGGWVYVYKGLMDEVGSDKDMLAGVIAHEVGHVTARHHAELMGRSTLYGIGIAVLTKGNTRQWVNFFANLNLLRWSRKHEYEADALGIKYTYSSTYNPDGLIRFLEVLQTKSKSEPSRFEAALRTHPVTSERIDRAKDDLAVLKAGR